MTNFQGKVIWITGASSGIGKALAIALSKQDCKLILSSRNKDTLIAVKNEIQNPKHIAVLPLDLANYNTMPTKVAEAISIFGVIDILINNGGISQRSAIIETSIDVDKTLMAINYFGTVALSKALLPYFVSRQYGHFVVVSSLMGKFSSPMRSAYCGAKHALHGFFDALRMEHQSDHIKVTMVCPGFVNTDVARNALTGSGSKQGHQDDKTQNGLAVDVFAKKMLKAIQKEKFEVYIGRFEVLAIYIKRLSNRLLHRLVLKSDVR